ncbi:hypothetical protein BJV82DRAFT_699925 [Fennellomyces sp. T-0311]|nr:hypothetical protein BJV82DRAFT_699925 [Fennellomyces sp. T-0311]
MRNCTSADASPENDHVTLEVLMREVEGDTRSNADETTTVDDDPMFRVDEPTGSDEDLVEAESAVLKEYFSDLQERFKDDTSKYGMSSEYCRGSFWVEPPAPFFALRNQEDMILGEKVYDLFWKTLRHARIRLQVLVHPRRIPKLVHNVVKNL